MTILQQRFLEEINNLPVFAQKEVLDFILFLKSRLATESDTIYLSSNAEIKQAIVDGLNTPLSECSQELDW